jgi:hypothetical protein
MNVRFISSKIVAAAFALALFVAIWVWAAASAGRGAAKIEQPAVAPPQSGAQHRSALPAPPAASPRRAAVSPRPVTRTRAS